ncbi:BsuBI/PstI family type II restriction endonuclease [Corynebacterium phocae]|uniref:BsuBI/PstI family type II restriction endonuclease n=1 Tax=Corynebacterium phocae TaxID=161895 RepID=UPI000A0320A7|nr:BsuBI/PstI family type II restriction endonuclease [Corynebacterium phocae]KAA8728647.1 restriction endonuclease [Corynebacterium phocae]
MKKLDQAREILTALGFDAKRTNALACRTLLALANVSEQTPWDQATNDRMGVRAIMDFMRERLDYPIAENSRESVRRFVLKQFVEVGFCLSNDDDPARPTNSSKNNYRLSDSALPVLRHFLDPNWEEYVAAYLAQSLTQIELQKAARELERFDIVFPSGSRQSLKAGGQNQLIKEMVEVFCPHFIKDGEVLYIGDADQKLVIYEEETLHSLGIHLDPHGKFPDLVVLDRNRNWLFLMEAATTHGPIDHSRYRELHDLFKGSSAGLVLISCFPDKRTLRKFLPDLAWETEVWVAEEPTHMIHLNGSRFLGPY